MAKYRVYMVKPPVRKMLDRSVSLVVEAGDPASAARKAKAAHPSLMAAAAKKVSNGTEVDIV